MQVMSQNFFAWKKTLDDLISRRFTVPSLNLDQRKINHIQTIKALCTLQTKEVNKRPYVQNIIIYLVVFFFSVRTHIKVICNSLTSHMYFITESLLLITQNFYRRRKKQGVALTGRNNTGLPAAAFCPLVSYVAYACVTDDRRRRQTPATVTTLPPTLCVGGTVIISVSLYHVTTLCAFKIRMNTIDKNLRCYRGRKCTFA